MTTKLPRYIRALRGRLFYQRDYPVRLREVFDKKTFTHPLGIRADAVKNGELHRAIAKAEEEYELSMKRMQNSDPDVYSEDEKERLTIQLLRKLNRQPGEFADDEHFHGYADKVVPGVDDAIDEANYRDLTIEEQVRVRAYQALQEKAAQRPKLLSKVWDEYVKDNGIDIDSRDGKRKQRRWERIFACIGERQLDAPDTLDAIHQGIDSYWDDRITAGAKVQSVRREYAETVSALRHASTKYRLRWVIEPNTRKTKADPVKQKVVLDSSEQINVLKYCLADNKTPEVSAAIILMMQSGAMASEIARLDKEAVVADLQAAIPQVSIGKNRAVKTEDRRRVVPIVFGRDYLVNWLPKAIDWCSSRTDSNVSHRIKNLLKKITGNEKVSAHCLRHTLKANADIVSANLSHVACIGGWSGDNKTISGHMQQYGSEGLSRSEGFKAVTETSKQIHKQLIEAADAVPANVVPIRKKRARSV